MYIYTMHIHIHYTLYTTHYTLYTIHINILYNYIYIYIYTHTIYIHKCIHTYISISYPHWHIPYIIFIAIAHSAKQSF